MSEVVKTIDADAFDETVLKSSRPVVLDFFSTECPPCDALAPKYEALAKLYGDEIEFLKIFRQGNRELADALGVSSSPTLLFFRDGEEVGARLTGGIKRAAIAEQLDALLPDGRGEAIRQRVERVQTECDVLILGAGPAGLTAGIYAAQAKLDTIIVDRGLAGGNLSVTHTVSNFPGFPEPQPGFMLAHYMLEHTLNAGAQFRQAVDVTAVDLERHEVVLDDVETIRAKKIIIATGSSPRPLGVDGEQEYKGRGISYCATCDAKYYEGKHVVVIGGGNSAIEEALFIAKFASRITVVHQFAELQANKQAQEAAFANEKISFIFEHEPRVFEPRGSTIGAVQIEDLRTGDRRTVECDGVFVFAGMQPNLELFNGQLERDDFGYLRVDEQMHTNVPNVFAAGDIRSKLYRQMTTAVSDGTVAAMTIARELGA